MSTTGADSGKPDISRTKGGSPAIPRLFDVGQYLNIYFMASCATACCIRADCHSWRNCCPNKWRQRKWKSVTNPRSLALAIGDCPEHGLLRYTSCRQSCTWYI